ncbi:carbon storage regulator CsrA [archaeon]|jgi:carbon storage regulator|nr:carbon storage regulator CsrA [archaeon]
MLVLSRKRDESIIIGDNIRVTIVDIRGEKVRLGIDAPTEVPVYRREVHEAIQRENLRAAQLKPNEPKQHHSENYLLILPQEDYQSNKIYTNPLRNY